jgi:hypothetical protein
MRAMIASLTLAGVLLTGPAALAGPSCVDLHGEMRRCGTQGAMPVGWSLPPDESAARLAAMSTDLDPGKLAGLICFLGGLFALIALMPDFDGAWDGEDGDDEPSGSH